MDVMELEEKEPVKSNARVGKGEPIEGARYLKSEPGRKKEKRKQEPI